MPGQPAFAVDKALVERLHSADAASALDIEGLKPWHLKLAIQLYDAKGLPLPDQGTIEEWLGRAEVVARRLQDTRL